MPLINSTFRSKVRRPEGAALLDYLARRFDYRTRDQWADLLSKGRLELDGRKASGEETLADGQRLLFHVVDYEEPEVPLDWAILPPEGPAPHPEDLMFVHKPAGMPVHRTGRIFFQTLANLVKEKMGDGAWAPLNRLDRETSGIVAFARGAQPFHAFAPFNKDSRWTKLYAAMVRGVPPEGGIGRIDQPLGEVEGDAIRSRMHAHAGGKAALTLYQSLESRAGYSLVVLSPITGRKHQLRAHMAWLGCPVVGDKMYSEEGRAYLTQLERELNEEDFRRLGARRHLLHSFSLRIESRGRGAAGAEDFVLGSEPRWEEASGRIKEWMGSESGRAFLEATVRP